VVGIRQVVGIEAHRLSVAGYGVEDVLLPVPGEAGRGFPESVLRRRVYFLCLDVKNFQLHLGEGLLRNRNIRTVRGAGRRGNGLELEVLYQRAVFPVAVETEFFIDGAFPGIPRKSARVKIAGAVREPA